MAAFDSQDKYALIADLDKAQEKLAALNEELSGVDHELANLHEKGQRFKLLSAISDSLDELRKIGGEDLFWNELLAEGDRLGHMTVVRSRADNYRHKLKTVEEARVSLLERVQAEQDEIAYLEDELQELYYREEEKKLEWLLDRDPDEIPPYLSLMPWSSQPEVRTRLRKSMASTLLLSLLLALLFPFIDLPAPDPTEEIEVPERLTRLIQEVRPTPPPPPPEPLETRPEEIEQKKTEEPTLADNPKPKAEPAAKPEKTMETRGILAFKERFSSIADAANLNEPQLGARARINRSGETRSGAPSRSLVTTHGPGTSGGINLAALSREVGGGGGAGIEGVEIVQATSSIGGTGTADRPLSGGPGPARTDEEIQIVFDRHKSALYRLYNRELRRDPTLRGQMVLRMTIEPDGSVSLCEVKSTDLDAPTLSSQVVARVKTFDFGVKEGVSAITILYPIDFLPAT